MQPLRIRSFAKINLVLAVLGRRPDGYHDIETVFQAIDLADEIEFRECARIKLRTKTSPEWRRRRISPGKPPWPSRPVSPPGAGSP